LFFNRKEEILNDSTLLGNSHIKLPYLIQKLIYEL